MKRSRKKKEISPGKRLREKELEMTIRKQVRGMACDFFAKKGCKEFRI